MPATITDSPVQHLFLLVGTNPLPNYVAARRLTTVDAYIYLVHSDTTKRHAEQLRKLLFTGADSDRVTLIRVDEANAADIYDQVRDGAAKAADSRRSVGLNYTGGTKVMSVHAYRAVADAAPDAIFSYLDAGSRAIRVHDARGDASRFLAIGDLDAARAVHLTIEEMLRLHNLSIETPGRHEARLPLTADAIRQEYIEHIERHLANRENSPKRKTAECFRPGTRIEGKRNEEALSTGDLRDGLVRTALLRDAAKRGIEHPASLSAVADPDFAEAAHRQNEHARRSGKDTQVTPTTLLLRWLGSDWLEDYVVSKLVSLRSRGIIQDLAAGVEVQLTNGRKFEIDAVAARGYQVYLFSCTVDQHINQCKSKLVEAVVRAEQMGGAEARVALVCGYNDHDHLLAEVKPNIPLRRVRVFGPSTFADLETRFCEWFSGK